MIIFDSAWHSKHIQNFKENFQSLIKEHNIIYLIGLNGDRSPKLKKELAKAFGKLCKRNDKLILAPNNIRSESVRKLTENFQRLLLKETKISENQLNKAPSWQEGLVKSLELARDEDYLIVILGRGEDDYIINKEGELINQDLAFLEKHINEESKSWK